MKKIVAALIAVSVLVFIVPVRSAPQTKIVRQKWEYAEWTAMSSSNMFMVSFKSADKKITKTKNGTDLEDGAKATFELYQEMGGKQDKLYNGAVDIFNLFGDDGWELSWKGLVVRGRCPLPRLFSRSPFVSGAIAWLFWRLRLGNGLHRFPRKLPYWAFILRSQIVNILPVDQTFAWSPASTVFR